MKMVLVIAKVPQYADKNGTEQVVAMVRMADLTRKIRLVIYPP